MLRHGYRIRVTIAALLATLTLICFACTSGSNESVEDIFNAPVSFGDVGDIDISADGDVPNWDYPDMPLSDGRVTRVIWLSKGEAAPFDSMLTTHPHVVDKKVAVAILSGFPAQFRRDYEAGQELALKNFQLEALSLTGLTEEVDEVTDVIVAFQKSIPQIEIGIRVVEVLEQDAFAFGVDTSFSSVERNGPPTRTFFNQAATTLGLPAIPGQGDFTPGALDPPLLVDLGTVTNGVRVDFLIRALKLFSRADLLSAPHMRVLHGHAAEIIAGQEIPFFTPQFNSSGLNSVTTAFKNVGIKLYVAPRVIGRDLIRINLTTAVEAVTGESTFESSDVSVTNPIITTRRASTVMDVYDNDTAIIGGLLTRSKFNNENRVPILGEIPVLNVLFSSRSKQVTQSNLIFFITPKIIDPSRDRRRMITPVPPALEESGDPDEDSSKGSDDKE